MRSAPASAHPGCADGCSNWPANPTTTSTPRTTIHICEPPKRSTTALTSPLVSLSSPLGIELLPADEGAELLAAYHDGALALPRPFRAWAAASLTAVDPATLGATSISVSSG